LESSCGCKNDAQCAHTSAEAAAVPFVHTHGERVDAALHAQARASLAHDHRWWVRWSSRLLAVRFYPYVNVAHYIVNCNIVFNCLKTTDTTKQTGADGSR
jgi:hypothetical protein